VALPHVESSYNPEARSFVGAAGLWQFTAGTGRQYLRIDSVVDERRDPFRSSDAAARYLRANYNSLNSWPLAITAYNHGAGGMRRAVREMGTDNIETIIRNYSGKAFGFASRNFYVSFLAAEEVDRNAARHFGPVRLDDPDPGWVIEMPAYLGAASLAAALQVPTEALKAANPALLPPVWAGNKYVPRGLNVRLPGHVNPDDARARLASIPAPDRKSAQVADPVSGSHRVRRGETLSGIAARYGTTSARLASLNGLSKANFIREGQVLKLGNGAPAQARPGTPAGNSKGNTDTYVVRQGDNLAGIAKRTGVPQSRLMALNEINNPHRILPGQRLRLSAPASGG
jgi:membrane-bound lytic murein transglycosylase D